MNASCIKNTQVADPGIDDLCTHGNYTTSTHTTDLTSPSIPLEARSYHIFHHLVSGSLLSIGQFCDTGCETWIDASSIQFTYKQQTILTGTRQKCGAWYVQALDAPHINYLLKTNIVNDTSPSVQIPLCAPSREKVVLDFFRK